MQKLQKPLSMLAAVLLLAGCASQSTAPTPPTFSELASQIWQAETALRTPAAGTLTDMSAPALAARQQQRLALQQQLQAVDLTTLNEQDKINHAILSYRLADEIDQYRFNGHLMPLTSESGFHTSLAFSFQRNNLRQAEDYQQ